VSKLKSDGTSILDGWVHPSQRKAEKPKEVFLYGRWWSAEDAAYAAELQADTSLRAPDLERLWRTRRPSVRSAREREQAELSREQEREQAPEPELEREHAVPADTDFARWLAGSGLTIRAVADKLGVSVGLVHKWKARGAPADVMARLAEGS
jgi:hypothetical protein